MPEVLTGIGVCAGVAAGPLLRIAAAPALPAPGPVTDTAAEFARAEAALAEVVAELGGVPTGPLTLRWPRCCGRRR